MTRRYLTGFWPFRLVPIDADTGKPLDPCIGRRTMVTYYDVKKDKNGNRSIVAHKSPAPSEHGGNDKGSGGEKKKNGENGMGKNGGNNKNSEEKKGGGGGGGDSKPDEKEWTRKEDAKLKELKDLGNSWRDIAQELGRPQYQIKNRWKEINKDGGGDAGGKVAEKKDQAKKNGSGDAADQQQMSKKIKKAARKVEQENDVAVAEKKRDKYQPAKAPSKAGSTRSGEARFTMNEWMTLQADSLFSFGELRCLSELIMRDQNQTWLRIAAAFYDKTGRRVHPDDIREKFEEMARTG